MIEIAGITLEVQAFYDFTYRMCIPYLANGTPEFRVTVSRNEIEQEKNNDFNAKQKFSNADETYEFLALLRKIADIMVDYHVLLIHGAAISLENRAYLFTGKSGTGKTTHIFKWLQHRPDLTIINGDKPFIKFGEFPTICGSPWCGKEGFYSNTIKPLSSIIALERSEDNHIQRMTFSEALPSLLQSIHIPNHSDKKIKAIKMLSQLDKKVVFYKYHMNNLKDDCFQVIYDVLHGQ